LPGSVPADSVCTHLELIERCRLSTRLIGLHLISSSGGGRLSPSTLLANHQTRLQHGVGLYEAEWASARA